MWRGGLRAASLNRHSVLRFHIPLVEPDMRISRIRLSGGRRLQSHAVCSAQTPSREGQACSGVASSFFLEVLGLRHSSDVVPFPNVSEVRPFRLLALPGNSGTTSLSATPACPSRAASCVHLDEMGRQECPPHLSRRFLNGSTSHSTEKELIDFRIKQPTVTTPESTRSDRVEIFLPIPKPTPLPLRFPNFHVYGVDRNLPE